MHYPSVEGLGSQQGALAVWDISPRPIGIFCKDRFPRHNAGASLKAAVSDDVVSVARRFPRRYARASLKSARGDERYRGDLAFARRREGLVLKNPRVPTCQRLFQSMRAGARRGDSR